MSLFLLSIVAKLFVPSMISESCIMEGFNLFDRKNFDKMECQTHESLLPIDVKESVIAPNEKFNKVIF